MSAGLTRYEKETRPWGSFERYTHNEPSTVKIITVNPDQQFSLQRHQHRSEFWKVISGSGIITIGETEHEAVVGDEFMVEVGELHRAKGGPEGLKFLEIALGDLDENDIERLADDYGRI